MLKVGWINPCPSPAFEGSVLSLRAAVCRMLGQPRAGVWVRLWLCGNIPGAGTCIPSWKTCGRWWFDGCDAQPFCSPSWTGSISSRLSFNVGEKWYTELSLEEPDKKFILPRKSKVLRPTADKSFVWGHLCCERGPPHCSWRLKWLSLVTCIKIHIQMSILDLDVHHRQYHCVGGLQRGRGGCVGAARAH